MLAVYSPVTCKNDGHGQKASHTSEHVEIKLLYDIYFLEATSGQIQISDTLKTIEVTCTIGL